MNEVIIKILIWGFIAGINYWFKLSYKGQRPHHTEQPTDAFCHFSVWFCANYWSTSNSSRRQSQHWWNPYHSINQCGSPRKQNLNRFPKLLDSFCIFFLFITRIQSEQADPILFSGDFCIWFSGDDCVSIVNASSNIKMKRIYCGPGHGIRYHLLWNYSLILPILGPLTSLNNNKNFPGIK